MTARQWLQTLETQLQGSHLAAAEVWLKFEAEYHSPAERNQFLIWLERDRAALLDAAARDYGGSGRLPLMDRVNGFLFRRRVLEAHRAVAWWLTTPGANPDADAPLAAWAETWLVEWWRDAGQVRWAAVLLGLAGPPTQV